MNKQLSSLTLALTAYNEEAALEQTVAKAISFLSSAAADWELLIIDDGSQDKTNEIASSLANAHPQVKVHTHLKNKGMGGAIKTAIANAKKDWFCTIAADGQVNPNDLQAFLEPAQKSTAVFSTYSNAEVGIDRKVLTFGLRCILFLFSGAWKIPTGNYFIKTDLIRMLRLRADSFFLNFEVFFEIRKRPIDYQWTQISCARRQTGASKVRNFRTIFLVVIELLRYRLA